MTRVPERWDRGKWDQAHWDGQLGLDAAAGAIVVTGFAAGLRKTRGMAANKGTITVGAQTAILRTSRRLAATNGVFVVTGQAAELVYTPALPGGDITMAAAPGTIILAGNEALLTAAVTPPAPIPVPMPYSFGWPRASRPYRW